MEVGLRVRERVGVGADWTVTVAFCAIDPPAPVHVSVYVVVFAGVTA